MMPMAVPGTIDATMELALSQFPQYTPRALHRDPWILHFESFLNEEEVRARARVRVGVRARVP